MFRFPHRAFHHEHIESVCGNVEAGAGGLVDIKLSSILLLLSSVKRWRFVISFKGWKINSSPISLLRKSKH